MERTSLTRDQVAQLLRETDHFLMVPHVAPDPDTLGAAVGLAILLGRLGKTAWVYAPEDLPFDSHFLSELAPILRSPPPGNHWHPVVLDCGDPRRLPPQAELSGIWLNIDHHLGNHYFATHTWVDMRAAATTELVASLAAPLGLAFDPASATALYAGMLYDTRGFVSDQTRPETHALAAQLVAAGADPRRINFELNERLSTEALRVMGLALASLRSECGGSLVWTAITREMMAETGALESETDLILSQLPKISRAEVMLLFKELSDGSIKVSLRSRGQVDIHAIAQSFGGGGHQLASGIRLEASLSEAMHQVLNVTRAALPACRPVRAG
ncbi:MAG TPA: bifunctional oligoribonuclease/PAP phosphatase NrnA [Stenomitos sp.]